MPKTPEGMTDKVHSGGIDPKMARDRNFTKWKSIYGCLKGGLREGWALGSLLFYSLEEWRKCTGEQSDEQPQGAADSAEQSDEQSQGTADSAEQSFEKLCCPPICYIYEIDGDGRTKCCPCDTGKMKPGVEYIPVNVPFLVTGRSLQCNVRVFREDLSFPMNPENSGDPLFFGVLSPEKIKTMSGLHLIKSNSNGSHSHMRDHKRQ